MLLDGVDLREMSRSRPARAVVMVTQENFMFDGTIADNIGFGRPDATDAEIDRRRAAVGAQTSSPRCPTATTPTWPSAAAGCRPASAS